MAKQIWKPGNMLYPLPAVMVSTADRSGKSNIITVAWTGTVCTNPAMLYISVRPERYSYGLLKDSGEFVVNLTTEKLKKATDWCGVRSGRDVDKWKEMHLTEGQASKLDYAPIIEECPVNIECKVTEIKELGSHHMFLAKVEAVQVGEEYLDEKGRCIRGKLPMAGSFDKSRFICIYRRKPVLFYRHAFGRSCQWQVLTNEIIGLRI